MNYQAQSIANGATALTENVSLARVSRQHPCRICCKPDWCGYSDDGRYAVCMRVSEGSIKTTRNGGFLHVLRDAPDWRTQPRVRTVRLDTKDKAKLDLGPLATEYAAAVDLTDLQDFAEELGLSVEGLVRLGIGWSAKKRAWSFPMCDPEMRVMGIRLRSYTGRKWAVRGSREGLFLPTELDYSGPLLLCEGPTDTAAALDLGSAAVGRPSCSTGTRMVAKLARARDVVIVADNDAPGQKGARSLVSALLLHCKSVRLLSPPGGIKDLRAWKRAGATGRSLLELIEAAPVQRLRICGQRCERAIEHGC